MVGAKEILRFIQDENSGAPNLKTRQSREQIETEDSRTIDFSALYKDTYNETKRSKQSGAHRRAASVAQDKIQENVKLGK